MKKTDTLILLGALAVAAFIISRANAAQPAPATRQRTATVTVGPLLTGSPESVYGHGQALLDAWQRPSSSPSWDES